VQRNRGLGVVVVHGIVSEMGGWIDVESGVEQRPGDIRFVFVGGYVHEQLDMEFIRTNVYPFLNRPYPISALAHTVAETLKAREKPE
jgi:hypothetical protein